MVKTGKHAAPFVRRLARLPRRGSRRASPSSSPRTRSCGSLLARSLTRRLSRRANRPLVPCARRPDYLSIICRALKQVIRLDRNLVPYMKQQRELIIQSFRDQEVRTALEKVYGPPESGATELPPFQSNAPPINTRQLLKDEQALLKTQLLLAALDAKFRSNR